jgi:signal transduction histidine kinase
MLEYAQEFYSRAITSFKACYKESLEIKNKEEELLFRQQEVLDNIGLSYFKINQLDSAEYFYKKALDFNNQNRSKFDEKNLNAAEGVIIGNLGQLYAKKKEFSKAKTYLKESVEMNNNDFIGTLDALLQAIQLGHIYLQTDDLDSAKQVVNFIQNNEKKFYNPKDRVNYYKLASEYYRKSNDIDKFLFFVDRQKDLENEIEDFERNLSRISVLEQLKFAESDLKYRDLKNKNKVNSTWLIICAVFLIGTFIIIFLIYINLKKSKNNIKVLEVLNNKVNQQANELKINNLEKDKILRVVAHDLRNPIGGINSIAKIMLMDDLRESDREMVELIDNTSKDALVLINDILEFTNDNHNTDDHTVEKINVNTLINNTITLLRYRIIEKKQEIVFNGLKKDVWISGDREKLSRVFSNLINNASKFSLSEKTIVVGVELVQNMVVISVKDQGIGIQDEFKGSDINALSNNKRRGTSGEKSFGMGLSIANQIVKKYFELKQDYLKELIEIEDKHELIEDLLHE